jgi:hypothetical protein
MRVRFVAWLVSVLLLVSAAAMAHGGKKHVIGTVEKVGADTVTVKTEQGSVDVKLVAATVYMSVGADKVAKPAKLADLHPGQRVVIHAVLKPDNSLEADEVRFATAAPAVAPASK